MGRGDDAALGAVRLTGHTLGSGTPLGRTVLMRILAFKRRLQELRRMGIYQREILLRLSRGEFDEIPADSCRSSATSTITHFLRINDIAEGYRDLVTSALRRSRVSAAPAPSRDPPAFISWC